ncbi:hypothetical protein [Halomonas daqiaonensis]|uniref:hypothetical protein n=1 Tax=Halomonas daqiaonensis TaxID=650850 RepID=UPI001113F47D|nr:hypothetical protein [Halomonas daqiaonensis]
MDVNSLETDDLLSTCPEGSCHRVHAMAAANKMSKAASKVSGKVFSADRLPVVEWPQDKVLSRAFLQPMVPLRLSLVLYHFSLYDCSWPEAAVRKYGRFL